MPKTGPTYARIKPMRRASGMSEIVRVKEKSSAVHIIGAPALITAGYAGEAGANPALIAGFFATPGANSATDGATEAFIDKAYPGKEYVGSLNATLSQAMINSVANLTVSASTCFLDTTASISSAAQCVIVGPALGYAIGDTKPLVIFTVLGDKIQKMNA